jgi:hypothetical protein
MAQVTFQCSPNSTVPLLASGWTTRPAPDRGRRPPESCMFCICQQIATPEVDKPRDGTVVETIAVAALRHETEGDTCGNVYTVYSDR